jgi:hypothetical protein
MKKLIVVGLLVMVVSVPALAGERGSGRGHRTGENFVIRDKDYQVQGYIRDGRILDREYQTKGYIGKDGTVRDREYRPEGYLRRNDRKSGK